MLALLPLCALLGLFLALGNLSPEWGWRRSFLRATVVVGTYTVLSTEALSLVRGITPLGLSLIWAAPALGVWGWLVRRARLGRSIQFPGCSMPASWLDRILLICVVAIVVVTALVSWFAPPNTWDSLTYHMSRVAHWAQNRSLAPYATGIERQNFMSPGAEIMVLHTYVLNGGDQLANSVQWFAMVASLVGVSVLARQLGSGTTGQLVSAVFVATLPMGIAQASSTMTDYVEALWLIAAASECLVVAREDRPGQAAVFASLAAGLAVVTKPTSLAYLTPFALWIAVNLTRRLGLRASLRLAGIALLAVTALNAGYFGRNLALEGTPAGSRELTGLSVNQTLTWQALVSNLLRNASLHVGTPWPAINDALYLALVKVHVKLGLPDMADPRFSRHDVFLIRGTNTEETKAPNTQHAVLLVLSYPLALAFGRKTGKPVAAYGLAVVATFLIFSILFKFDLLASRYHLPFFVLAAPVVGAIVGHPIPPAVARGLGVVLAVLSWPWLAGIESRPLLPGAQNAASVMSLPRRQQYVNAGMAEALQAMVDDLREAGCKDIGVMFGGDAPEYALWAAMDMPDKDLRIEWIVAGTPSARYEDPGFEPCAVACDGSCASDMGSIRGLPLLYDASGLRLYMKPLPVRE